MAQFIIAACKPKSGMVAVLHALVSKQHKVLRDESLITDCPRVVMQARDGAVVEVFEWQSPEAFERAHTSMSVQALWTELGKVCEYIPLASIPECAGPFAYFESLTL